MSGASDIAKLFAVAGGSAAQYQEVERTEQQDGARGRWSAHADTDAGLAAQDEAALDAAQPLIAWSIAAVTDEPPPVVPVASVVPVVSATQEAPAIQSAAETPVEAQTPPAVAPVVEPTLAPPIEPAPESIVEPIAEPAVQTTPEPAAAAPQSAALSSVFARLMERNEPRADTAPRGKS
jgi:hypothetical protein